jgi:hypothetical protein
MNTGTKVALGAFVMLAAAGVALGISYLLRPARPSNAATLALLAALKRAQAAQTAQRAAEAAPHPRYQPTRRRPAGPKGSA